MISRRLPIRQLPVVLPPLADELLSSWTNSDNRLNDHLGAAPSAPSSQSIAAPGLLDFSGVDHMQTELIAGRIIFYHVTPENISFAARLVMVM